MAGSSYSLTEIASVTNGELNSPRSGNTTISEYLIDSRKLGSPEGCLFVALVSKRNDGHKFIPGLFAAGVRNFLVSEPVHLPPEANLVLVNNTLEALQSLSAYHRSQFRNPVIGITGSNGKTIVKEWLYQLMNRDRNIIRSPKSFNSQIGVPLSILNIEPYHDLAIIEAGISQPGEMQKLRNIIQPTIGIFTNIGQAHNENFRDIEQKIKEKLLLFRNADILIYSKDHQEIAHVLEASEEYNKLKTFTWGRKLSADLMITEVSEAAGRTQINGRYLNKPVSVRIPFKDVASIENALHCYALMLYLGYDQNLIATRMPSLTPIAMRLELKEGINRCTLINDSYNSDINSLTIAIDFQNQQKQHEKKTVILSDILQSGRRIDDLYSVIGETLSKKGISRIIGIGKDITSQADKFHGEKFFFSATDEFLSQFPLSSFHDETILLKGARIFEFEKISKVLEQKVHETVLEINLDALIHNLNHYRSKLKKGTRTMVMVKAFSYGSGSFEIANLLQFHGADWLAVAYADEGVELRKAGITLPIMVMNPEERSFDLLFRYDLEPEIYNFRGLTLLQETILNASNKPSGEIYIHVKLDSGMHRLGFVKDELPELLNRLRNHPKLRVRSVFSHLAASEDPGQDEFTRFQIREFNEMAELLNESLNYPVLKHILNSAGIVRFPEAQMDMVRLGIGLYGVGFDNREQKQLKNVSTLKTTISQIKEVKAGETVGYNRTGKVDHDSVIAIVPIGYADGLNRRLGNGTGKLFVNGKPAPIIGNISMDTCMIDITPIMHSPDGIRVREGDDVIVFGDEYLLNCLAKDLGTIPYEILTSISRRVKRVYYYE
ncbi:MAG: bifunctional UDP-N-acetylmuramoyl-tripeptide:D-alanyl-D-alanine ligase/alanine racemase [Bacteroidetes bacterium]|nr:bifunctional UDP-N-acetylmuramoyl-tripeptide:D-alanyl-D-alanine ligase/alanine racemase [Bacteroidota bacterium]